MLATLALMGIALAADSHPIVYPPGHAPGRTSGRILTDTPLQRAEGIAAKMMNASSTGRIIDWYDDLIELGVEHPDVVGPITKDTLGKLWTRSNKRMDTLFSQRAFEELLGERRELDALRLRALKLIRDESAYPYPCFLPSASPAQMDAYELAQEQIEELFESMRSIWKKSATVKPSRDLRVGSQLVLWIPTQGAPLKELFDLGLDLPAVEVPGWLHGLPVELEGQAVDLATFALSRNEADALARDRAIAAGNAGLIAASRKRRKSNEERTSVKEAGKLLEEINDYRRLLGLRVLRWDDRLERGAWLHADFLVDAAEITHEQPDPKWRTYLERAAHFNYPVRVFENCLRGPDDGVSAFRSWTHSSAHHRSIVSGEVTEMGAAVCQANWVQLFGLDTEFVSEIQCHPWRN